ncbi:hypothetical protein [Bacillus pumilus]|uniref:hypothetical protein n=1 Tax=Bacillus pumilus TaxID=1408 RepID=UPI0011A7A72B|nr:hypothetical protein [Bacillus pumilus]
MNKNEVFDFNIGLTVQVDLDEQTEKDLGLKSSDLFEIKRAFVDDEIHIYEVFNKEKGVTIQAYATDLIPVDLERDEIVD